MNIYLSLITYAALIAITLAILWSLLSLLGTNVDTSNNNSKLMITIGSVAGLVFLCLFILYAPISTVYSCYANYTSNLQLTIPTFTISSLYTAESLFYISMILHALFLYIFAFSTIVTFLYTTFNFTLFKILIRVFCNYLWRRFISEFISMPIWWNW